MLHSGIPQSDRSFRTAARSVVSATGAADGVRLKRGAGAGCSSPFTSMYALRALLCSCSWASHGLSTGVTQASEFANTSAQCARVCFLNFEPMIPLSCAQPFGSIWTGSSGSSIPRAASN